MARIQTYDNDIVVTIDDKVIGTDAVDNSTKNFTVGDIIGLVPTPAGEEKLALRIQPQLVIQAGPAQIVSFDITGDVSTGSLHSNPSSLSPQGSPITSVDMVAEATVRLSIGAFVDVLANNSRIEFALLENATPIGSAVFDGARAGVHAFSFFSYFKLLAGASYSFTVNALDADCDLIGGSFIEFYVVD